MLVTASKPSEGKTTAGEIYEHILCSCLWPTFSEPDEVPELFSLWQNVNSTVISGTRLNNVQK